MIRQVQELFKITGNGLRFMILLIFRCPFDTLRTILEASFLQISFIAISENNYHKLYIICAIFGIGSMFLFLYNGIVWMTFSGFVIHLVCVLREKLFVHISGLSLEQIESRSSGEWFTRLNSDVSQAMAVINQPIHLTHAAVALVNICFSSVIIAVVNPKFLGIVLLFLIPHILFSQFLVAKPIGILATKSQEATAWNTSSLNSFITCADTAVLYDAKDFLQKNFEETSLTLRKINMQIKLRNAISNALLPALGMTGYLVLLILGGTWIAKGDITFGGLTALFQYRGGVLLGSLMLTNSLINIKTDLAGVKRVNDTIHM